LSLLLADGGRGNKDLGSNKERFEEGIWKPEDFGHPKIKSYEILRAKREGDSEGEKQMIFLQNFFNRFRKGRGCLIPSFLSNLNLFLTSFLDVSYRHGELEAKCAMSAGSPFEKSSGVFRSLIFIKGRVRDG
jgi:hypothetical protein